MFLGRMLIDRDVRPDASRPLVPTEIGRRHMDTQEYRRACIDWINAKQEQKQARELIEAILLMTAAFAIFFVSLIVL